MKLINKTIEKLCSVLNIASEILIAAMMVLVVVNVALRAFFNSPIRGVYDILLMLFISAISLSLAHCYLTDGHVNITFIMDKFSEKVQKLVRIILNVISTIMFGAISWFLLAYYVDDVKLSGKTTLTTSTPHYPFYYVLAAGILILALVILMKIISEFGKGSEEK